MNARSAQNQLASNSCLQIPEYRVQSPVRPRPSPKQQVQQVQQQQLQAVMMAEPVLQANAFNSQPNRPAISQPSGATPQHRLHMTVNSSDVDMYGVVANTKYHEYMYAARAALGASAGLSMEVLLGQYGIMMATTSYSITFKSPLQYGDHFFAESVPCEVRGATCKFKERVVRVSSSGQEQVVAEGVATCVALVPANPPVKPARIPATMKEALLRCIAANTPKAATAN